MRNRDEEQRRQPTPTSQLSKKERQQYLNAARKRQNRRKLQSLNAKLKKRERRKHRGQSYHEPRRIITENWLENREWEEEKNKPVREIPAWLFPLLILVVLVLSLFFILPNVLGRFMDRPSVSNGDQNLPLDRVYEDNIMLAAKPVVDVFKDGNIRAERITQLLYNEPVERLSPKGSLATFYRVRLADGTIGYSKRSDLIEDSWSIEPADSIAKLLVTDLSKRVMTHASNGNLLVEVKMNTELFVLYSSDPLYRVKLPGGAEGWLDSTGVLELAVDEEAAVAGSTYFTDSIMAFNYATLLQHGMSNDGLSLGAAVHIAASVNGLDLASDIEGIRQETSLIDNAVNENGSLNYNHFERGDILFFYDGDVSTLEDADLSDAALDEGTDEQTGESTNENSSLASGSDSASVLPVTQIAVWIDYGIVLAERPREFVIRELDINTILNEATFIEARRIFND